MSPILEVKNLVKYFLVKTSFLSLHKEDKKVHAVDDITFDIEKAESFGLAGESGCGKTTTARLILGLLKPTSGRVVFMGKDIFSLQGSEMRAIRREMQMIFQDPYASLNPRKTVSQAISLPFKIYKIVDDDEIEAKITELLEIVGLSPAETFMDRYPHELSGGQKQRVTIARAIALRPKLILADEPISGLDMSIKAQILNLMKDLQERFDLTYLFITHDLAVLRSTCDRVAVMYLGKILELAKVKDLFDQPLNPYTKALLSATPIPKPRIARSREQMVLKGDVPSPINPPPGCRFHTRCPIKEEICVKREPELLDVGNQHYMACHLAK